jgi:hypothetical protein
MRSEVALPQAACPDGHVWQQISDYSMIQSSEPYHELVGKTFDKRRPEVTTRHLKPDGTIGVPD